MVKEIYEGEVDLKNPKQIEVNAVTDNRGLWENLNNTRQCETIEEFSGLDKTNGGEQ